MMYSPENCNANREAAGGRGALERTPATDWPGLRGDVAFADGVVSATEVQHGVRPGRDRAVEQADGTPAALGFCRLYDRSRPVSRSLSSLSGSWRTGGNGARRMRRSQNSGRVRHYRRRYSESRTPRRARLAAAHPAGGAARGAAGKGNRNAGGAPTLVATRAPGARQLGIGRFGPADPRFAGCVTLGVDRKAFYPSYPPSAMEARE